MEIKAEVPNYSRESLVSSNSQVKSGLFAKARLPPKSSKSGLNNASSSTQAMDTRHEDITVRSKSPKNEYNSNSRIQFEICDKTARDACNDAFWPPTSEEPIKDSFETKKYNITSDENLMVMNL